MSTDLPSAPELQTIRAIALKGTLGRAADYLCLSPHTVNSRVDSLRRKSGFHYLPQLVAWAGQNGWLEDLWGEGEQS